MLMGHAALMVPPAPWITVPVVSQAVVPAAPCAAFTTQFVEPAAPWATVPIALVPAGNGEFGDRATTADGSDAAAALEVALMAATFVPSYRPIPST